MKILLIGLPFSGRTTVAQQISQDLDFTYIDAMSWVKSTFRAPHKDEHSQQYEDEYQQYLTRRMVINPWFISDHVNEMMQVEGTKETVFVIDGVASPKDFTHLFDYREDVVVFLNRMDNEQHCRDHENIGTSVIRDYCFWMSSAGLLNKERWLEFNFRIPGEDPDRIKVMGAQNSVFVVKSIGKAISHLKEKLQEII